jgi:hypothetical protein
MFVLKKQWHAIAKKVKNGQEESVPVGVNRGLHQFASAFITKHTDLVSIVREKFPEQKDVKLLLTGKHLPRDCMIYHVFGKYRGVHSI